MIFAAFGSPQKSWVLLSFIAKILIPKAMNREPISLKGFYPVYTAIGVIQEAVPGIVRTVLRRTPPP